jgi:hypothetical protein
MFNWLRRKYYGTKLKLKDFRYRATIKSCNELGTTIANFYPYKKYPPVTLIVTPEDFVGEVRYYPEKDIIQITDKENNSVLEIKN